MAAVTAARSHHAICELARLADCGECWAPSRVPCLRGSRGTRGYHVARFARAYRRGLLTGADLNAVLDHAEVFCNSTVIYDGNSGVPA
jgi:hypothetical protein